MESSIYSLTCVRELCTVLISDAGVLKVEARHVTVDTELSTGGVRHSQAKVVRVVWSWGLKRGQAWVQVHISITFSDDVAVVCQRVDDLIPDPSDGNVDPIPHGNPESLELTLLEADLCAEGGQGALLLSQGVCVLSPASLEQ